MREGAPVNDFGKHDFGKLDVIARRAFAPPDEAISPYKEIASGTPALACDASAGVAQFLAEKQ